MSLMFDKLHAVLKEAAMELRNEFDAKDIGHMTLDIKVSGRVHGEIKISYELCENYDVGVKGSRLHAVLIEYFRRKGWNTLNAPVALPAPELAIIEPRPPLDAQ